MVSHILKSQTVKYFKEVFNSKVMLVIRWKITTEWNSLPTTEIMIDLAQATTALWPGKVLGGINPVTSPTSMVCIWRQGRHLGKELIGKNGKTTLCRWKQLRWKYVLHNFKLWAIFKLQIYTAWTIVQEEKN